ncbi:MAG: hypothetical protein WBV46_12525 [Terriglobales bacterium]
MKRMRIASTLLFCLLFAAFAYASPRQQDEPKAKEASPAAQPPDAKPEAKPETQEQKPDEMKPEKQEKNDQEMKSNKDQEKQDKDQEKQEQKDQKNAGKENNMRNDNQAHAKPAGKGGRIPDDKFRSSFGRSHTFHPSRPVIVNNQPTFNYGGYSFVMVDAWPAGWAYTDDCYIDYIDGEYFLFDLLHPGVRIELFVSM